MRMIYLMILIVTSCSEPGKNHDEITNDKKTDLRVAMTSKRKSFILGTKQDSIEIEKAILDAKKIYGLVGLAKMKYIAKLTDFCNDCLKGERSVVEFHFESNNEFIGTKLVDETNTNLESCIDKYVEREGTKRLNIQNDTILRIDLVSYKYSYFERLWNKRLLQEELE